MKRPRGLGEGFAASAIATPVGRRLFTFEMAFWMSVAALVPIYRYATSLGLSQLPYIVLFGLLVSVFAGHADWRRGTVLWVSSAMLILAGSLFSGIATDVIDTLKVGVPFAIMIFLAPSVFSYNIRVNPKFTHNVLWAFLVSQSLSAIAGLLQLGGIFISSREFKGRATGLGDHPNILGLMSAVAILAAIGLLLGSGLRRRGVVLGVLLLNLAALVMSGSLSSIMALFSGLLIIVVVARGVGRRVFPVVLFCLTSFAFAVLAGLNPFRVFEPISERIAVVTGQAEGVASLNIREETYRFALSSIPKYPVTGVGMDSRNEGTYNGVTVVHNYLLRAFYQGGIFLFLAVLLVTLYVGMLILNSMSVRANMVASAVALGVFVYALTSAFYDQQQYWLLILFCAAVMQVPVGAENRLSVSMASRAITKS